MNTMLVKDLVDGTYHGTVTFPEIVMKLSAEGFESYHVDYLAGENRYYHLSDEMICEKPKHQFPPVAKTFCAEKLRAVIRKVQAGGAKYQEFLEESAAAGCVYYIVSLAGRKVTYFGRDGGEHIEYFPGSL